MVIIQYDYKEEAVDLYAKPGHENLIPEFLKVVDILRKDERNLTKSFMSEFVIKDNTLTVKTIAGEKDNEEMCITERRVNKIIDEEIYDCLLSANFQLEFMKDDAEMQKIDFELEI